MCGRYSLLMDQDAVEIANIIEEVSREHPSVETKSEEHSWSSGLIPETGSTGFKENSRMKKI